MEQKDSVTAKNHLSKRRKGEHRNCAGRKWLSGSGKRVAHSDPLALISRASLEQRIIFNQLFVSMPGIETKGLYIETKKKKKRITGVRHITTLGDRPFLTYSKRLARSKWQRFIEGSWGPAFLASELVQDGNLQLSGGLKNAMISYWGHSDDHLRQALMHSKLIYISRHWLKTGKFRRLSSQAS